jgi:hypothetical protein
VKELMQLLGKRLAERTGFYDVCGIVDKQSRVTGWREVSAGRDEVADVMPEAESVVHGVLAGAPWFQDRAPACRTAGPAPDSLARRDRRKAQAPAQAARLSQPLRGHRAYCLSRLISLFWGYGDSMQLTMNYTVSGPPAEINCTACFWTSSIRSSSNEVAMPLNSTSFGITKMSIYSPRHVDALLDGFGAGLLLQQ